MQPSWGAGGWLDVHFPQSLGFRGPKASGGERQKPGEVKREPGLQLQSRVRTAVLSRIHQPHRRQITPGVLIPKGPRGSDRPVLRVPVPKAPWSRN